MRNISIVTSLLLLSTPVPAHAALITGRAMGTITVNNSPPSSSSGAPYQFTPGEAVSVTFGYDPQLSVLLDTTATGQTYRVRPGTFRVNTSGGFTSGGGPPPNSNPDSNFGLGYVTNGPTDIFELDLSTGSAAIGLRFTDPTGTALSSTALPTLAELLRFPGATLSYYREFDGASFQATVVPVADFPVPEPSTLALGLVGFGLAGGSWMRRRGGTSRLV